MDKKIGSEERISIFNIFYFRFSWRSVCLMTVWTSAAPPHSIIAFWEPMGSLWSFDLVGLADRAPGPFGDRHGIEMM